MFINKYVYVGECKTVCVYVCVCVCVCEIYREKGLEEYSQITEGNLER